MVGVTERAPRADRGLVRCTPRDVEALAWLGEMRCAWLPDVAVLLGRLAGREPLAESGARTVVERWRRAGWVAVSKPWTALAPVVVLQPQGAAMVSEEASAKPPALVTVQHAAEVARVRLWLEGRASAWGAVTGWTSERSYRRERFSPTTGGEPGHYPDAVAAFELVPECAIEVELTPKDGRTLAGIVEELALTWPATLYVVGSPRVRALVERCYAELLAAGRVASGRVTVLDLPGGAA